MTRTLTHPATTPTPATTGPRAFTPAPGTYEAVCVTAQVLYELEAIDAALRVAGLPLNVITERLDAAREAHHAANDAYLAPLTIGIPF